MTDTSQSRAEELLEAISEVIDIGTYRYKNGTTTPAIQIDRNTTSNQPRPNTSGLEIVIEPQTSNQATTYIGGDIIIQEETKITLKEWDPRKDIKDCLKTLMILLSEHLIDNSINYIPRNSETNIDQASFRIRQTFAYLKS